MWNAMLYQMCRTNFKNKWKSQSTCKVALKAFASKSTSLPSSGQHPALPSKHFHKQHINQVQAPASLLAASNLLPLTTSKLLL